MFKLFLFSLALICGNSFAMQPVSAAHILREHGSSYQQCTDFIKQQLTHGNIPLDNTANLWSVYGQYCDGDGGVVQAAPGKNYTIALVCDNGVCELQIEDENIVGVKGFSMDEFHKDLNNSR